MSVSRTMAHKQSDSHDCDWAENANHNFIIREIKSVEHTLEGVSQQAYNIVADSSDREAFDGLLQSQLQLRSLAHSFEDIAVLLLHCDIDLCAQQLRCPRQFPGQIYLPLFYRKAGLQRRRHPPTQEGRKCLPIGHGFKGDGSNPAKHDVLIGG